MSHVHQMLDANNLIERTMDATALTVSDVDFKNWISSNWSIWEAFYLKAKQMASMGREHYSARTICEVLRWETDLQEADSQYKISNNVIPKMARLFEAVHPEYSGFFRKKGGS